MKNNELFNTPLAAQCSNGQNSQSENNLLTFYDFSFGEPIYEQNIFSLESLCVRNNCGNSIIYIGSSRQVDFSWGKS